MIRTDTCATVTCATVTCATVTRGTDTAAGRRRLPLRRAAVGTGLLASTVLALAACGPVRHENLVLDSTFDGPAGAPPPAPWIAQLGGGGWGNDELQTYTDRPENVSLDGQGHLRITARREDFTGTDGIRRAYTSARLSTETRFSFTYGRVEARIATPHGPGLWPAFWLLGDIAEQADWRTAGEIDVLEVFGTDPRRHATVHGFSDEPRGWSQTAATSDLIDLTRGFHTYTLTWEPGRVRVAVDGAALLDVDRSDLGAGRTWSVDKPLHLMLNLAVGGSQPGLPDDTTPLPAELLVDSVRVWQETSS